MGNFDIRKNKNYDDVGVIHYDVASKKIHQKGHQSLFTSKSIQCKFDFFIICKKEFTEVYIS